MKKLSLLAVFWLAFASPVYAANVNIDGLPAATSATGTDLLECEQSGTNNKCTAAQEAAYVYGLMSSDATASGTGVVTLKNTGPGATGPLGSATVAPIVTIDAKGRVTALTSATVTPAIGSVTGLGAGVATALAIAPGSAGAFVTFGGAGGTPSSITLTNGTGLPFTGVTGRFALSQAPQGIANSIWINPTGSTADMQNVAVPACANDGIHALVYINGTGLQCASLTTGGAGTVTSVSAGCGTSTGGSAITTTGTVTAALTARTNTANSGVGADFVSSDCGGIVYDNSASSIAVSLPVATTSGFGANTFFARCNINAGVSTITPVTSTIGGGATLVVGAGTALKPTCVYFRSDGTNYFLTETPFGTAATQNTGTSGATIPLLNGNNTSSGNNTHSGSETFTEVIGGGRTVSGTTDTLAATDCGTTITYSNAGAVTVTVPQGLPSFCVIALIQLGAGKVSTNGSAVTPATQHAAGSFTGTRAQFSVINITNYTTNTVILSGDAS